MGTMCVSGHDQTLVCLDLGEVNNVNIEHGHGHGISDFNRTPPETIQFSYQLTRSARLLVARLRGRTLHADVAHR